MYYKVYNGMQSESEQAIDSVFATAEAIGSFDRLSPDYITFLGRVWAPMRYPEWAVVKSFQDVGHYTPSSPICACASFQLFDGLRHVQRNITLSLRLERALNDTLDPRERWLTDEAWQPLRRYAEQLLATSGREWGETTVASNLVLKPLLSSLAYDELATMAGVEGDIATAHLALEMARDEHRHIDWTHDLVKYLHEDRRHADANHELTQGWVEKWLPRAVEAVSSMAQLHGERLDPGWRERAAAALDDRLEELGLSRTQASAA